MIQTNLRHLIKYASTYLMMHPSDEDYCFNRLLLLMGLDDCGAEEPVPSVDGLIGPDSVLEPILADAVARGIIDE